MLTQVHDNMIYYTMSMVPMQISISELSTHLGLSVETVKKESIKLIELGILRKDNVMGNVLVYSGKKMECFCPSCFAKSWLYFAKSDVAPEVPTVQCVRCDGIYEFTIGRRLK